MGMCLRMRCSGCRSEVNHSQKQVSDFPDPNAHWCLHGACTMGFTGVVVHLVRWGPVAM
jgi:hypothetical protein